MSERVKVVTRTPYKKRENLASKVRKPDLSKAKNSPFDDILHLQRTVGNQAFQRLFESGVIQVKIKIGKANDIHQ